MPWPVDFACHPPSLAGRVAGRAPIGPRSAARRRLRAAAATLILLASPTAARGDCPGEPGEAGTVVRALAGDTLVLESGLEVRLAGIEAPARMPGGEPAPSVENARAALDRLAAGKVVTIRHWGGHRDRYGRAVGEVLLNGGASLGEMLVAGGFARVRPGGTPEGCLTGLLAAEKAPRTARSGLWSDPVFAIREADDPSLRTQKGLYIVVEGRVASVGRGTRMVFLNFGRDWRSDFTVMVAASVAARLVGEGKASAILPGKWVLVRGVVEDRDGALIRVGRADEIEVLDDD